MLEKDLDLVRNIAWSYKRSTPEFKFDSLFSEGCIVYLESEKEYEMKGLMPVIAECTKAHYQPWLFENIWRMLSP